MKKIFVLLALVSLTSLPTTLPAAVPASDITLEAPIYDGMPVLATVTGYEMNSGCPGG
jgi:hypothetical protein